MNDNMHAGVHQNKENTIPMNLENFKQRTITATESDIDNMCIVWLRCLCSEYGGEGDRAGHLLDELASLLDISA